MAKAKKKAEPDAGKKTEKKSAFKEAVKLSLQPPPEAITSPEKSRKNKPEKK
jgi:hypothetical protein